jgi:hypothetical protein
MALRQSSFKREKSGKDVQNKINPGV